MKKKIMMIAVAVLVAGLLVVPVIAKGPSGQAGKSNIAHLYLYEKTPSDDTWGEESDDCKGWLKPWEIAESGAWGKMKYNLSGPTFDFVFNGHGLPVGQNFTLIYYPDKHGAIPDPDEEWPREDIICLGEGTVNDEGNIHIAESVDMQTSLPIHDVDSGDCNYGWAGAKIWLVLSDDVNCDGHTMSGWRPTAYLFEGDVIYFVYTVD